MSQTQMGNERRKKKIIVAAIGVFMIAAAMGIGFAVVYTGTVDNTSNEVESRYYVVSLDSNMNGLYDEITDYTDAFSGQIYFDSVNMSSGVVYTPHVETIDGATCALIDTVNVKVHGPEDLESYDDYTLSITHGSALSQNFKIVVTVGGSTTFGTFGSGAGQGYSIDATGAEETVFTISLYMVFTALTTDEPDSYTFTDHTFTFDVSATA